MAFFVLFQILFVVYGQRCLMIDIVDRYFYLIFSFIRAFVFIVKCCCCFSILFFPTNWMDNFFSNSNKHFLFPIQVFYFFFSVLFLFVNDQQTHYYSHELMMRIIIKIPARHTYMIILCFIRINHSILSLQIQLASVILIINKHVNHTNFVVYILRKICPKKRFSHTQTHTLTLTQ